MPELPEVETVCRALRPVLEGRSLAKVQCNRPDLRYPLPTDMEGELKGHIITGIRRRAKYILIDFNHGLTLIGHLGMSGRVLIEPPSLFYMKPGPHDHVIFMTSHQYKITLRDPRRFGFLLLKPTHHLENLHPFCSLGFEPLGDHSLVASRFQAVLKTRAVSIKSALLNQAIIAGLGNIYACEALWQAKISPLRLTNTLTLEETKVLLKEIDDVLTRAIDAGGSTLRDHVQPNGNTGYFQHSLKAYNRANQPCVRCKVTLLTKIIQSSRATYYCRECQQ
ncbi:MAG: mutM [Alphaproteobacteria bacterium]|nr:mutM [Alphaproteobacteria bacterium]